MELSRNERLEIAANIMNQLGGKKFSMMTGAKDILATNCGVRFKIGRNSAGVNMVHVDYDHARDAYDVRFEKVAISKKTFEVKRKVIGEFSNVYCDQLAPIFESTTGLRTRLF